MNVQDDMNEVSKIAHNIKSRLEHLQRVNEAALDRKASLVQSVYSAWKRMYRQQTWSVTPALSQAYTDEFATKPCVGNAADSRQHLCTRGSCSYSREKCETKPACAYHMWV